MSPVESPPIRPAPREPEAPARIPRKWTLHGLNNGVIFGLTVRGVQRLPRWLSYALGTIGTWVAWRLMPTTNRAIADNLRALRPDDDEATLMRAALRTYRSYAYDTIDFLRALTLPAHRLTEVFDVVAVNRRLFQELSERGRGAIVVTGHFGNWEAGGILMRRIVDLPLTIVAMAEADPEVNRLRTEIRESLGVKTLEVRGGLETGLQIRRLLSQGQFIALLIDRHLGKDRVRVEFLGRPAWFLRTPALMAYLTGAPLLPCVVERQGGGRFLAVPTAPIYVDRELPRDRAIEEATQRVADALAERVRARPECWYHFYRYWDAQRDEYDGLA